MGADVMAAVPQLADLTAAVDEMLRTVTRQAAELCNLRYRNRQLQVMVEQLSVALADASDQRDRARQIAMACEEEADRLSPVSAALAHIRACRDILDDNPDRPDAA